MSAQTSVHRTVSVSREGYQRLPPHSASAAGELPSAISYQLSAISYQLSAISYQLSAISYQLSAISYQLTTEVPMPRPLPILFIHGFNGNPGDWTDGGFRQYLLSTEAWIRTWCALFRYGVAEDGTYDDRGDLRQIASRLTGVGLTEKERLTCSVEQLSADSVARGGPAQVTLIAHSLGGIISRYYLSRTAPDEVRHGLSRQRRPADRHRHAASGRGPGAAGRN